jgi:hypothetical protein
MTPDQDEGHNRATAGTHSEVVVDGISEVAAAGEILLSQQVTSSSVVQVPPLHLAAPNTSTRAQDHSSAGDTSIFATPGEVQPNRMGQITTDFENLRTELRLGLAQLGAQMTTLLQTITDSTSNSPQTTKRCRPSRSKRSLSRNE